MKELLFFTYLALVLAAFGGWVANIVKLFGPFGGELTAELVLRIAGIPLGPLGAILGYM